jgi:hypothetical protein
MRFATVLCALAFATAGFGDTLTLRNGQVVNGTYMGGTARTVKMEVGDAIKTYDVSDIATLQFTAGTTTSSVRPAGVEPGTAGKGPQAPASAKTPGRI